MFCSRTVTVCAMNSTVPTEFFDMVFVVMQLAGADNYVYHKHNTNN
jgi:hypothetical protein